MDVGTRAGKGGMSWETGIELHTLCVLSHFSHVWLFATPWTVAHQAPLSTGFPRQEYRSGLPFAPPGELPDSGIEFTFPALQADSLPLNHQESPIMVLVNSNSSLYTLPLKWGPHIGKNVIELLLLPTPLIIWPTSTEIWLCAQA